MSKNSTRTASKTNTKNEALPRKASKLPATSGTAPTTSRSSKLKVKQQDSTESERSLRKTAKIATSTTATAATTASKKSPSLHTSKNKDRELVASKTKRTTPSPTTATKTARTSKVLATTSSSSNKVKPNAVLDTYHSVTVLSPPSKRKAQSKQTAVAIVEQAVKEQAVEKQAGIARTRKYSRTLQPEEIVVLKRDSAKQRSELQVQQQQHQVNEIKQPISFEVQFGTAKKPSQATANESDNYSDDFESYESDFETDASTPEEEEEEQEEQAEEQPIIEAEQSISEQFNAEKHEQDSEDSEDSEPTQNPITVIQRDKERKLDSGHYDMQKRRQTARQQVDDSFDTNHSMANSEQLDSGISSSYVTDLPKSTSTSDVHYGGYVDFVSRPVLSRRGQELMRKLRFDQLSYQLFEMKPLSYEGYMQSYGKLNTCQLATQTQSRHMDTECQTLELHMRSSWTQHPAHYGGQLLLQCSGDAGNANENHSIESNDTFDCSLARLEQLRRLEQQRALRQQRQHLRKSNDLEHLAVFLHRASLLLGKVLNANCPQQQVNPLQTGLLDALRVRRIFGSTGQLQLVVTVHESAPQNDVYRDDFANLLMVWSLTDASKPLRLLSTWAEVCRVCFSSEAPDIIVAGLRDGSVAMWDLRETHSYCSKLDGNLTHFAATQSVVPSLPISVLDLGAVVDVRSFRAAPKTAGMAMGSSLAMPHKDIQYASLNDSGLLTIWTLVDSGRGCSASSRNEYCSPWARVKLLQAVSCDLRDYLERRLLKRQQSCYEKTKSLFQGNVYSDELLRELDETQTLTTALANQGLQGLRFSSIDAGSELIYVCTNRNFILCCTRSLKPERFQRIGIHESRFLFPTSLCVLANEHFVAVGLSNGSVMILNCNQRQRQRLIRPTTVMPETQIAPDPETGKSCAIQNIILNERRSFDQQDLERNNYDARPNTALQLLQQPRRSYEMRSFDQQLLLSGSSMRQHLVQALVQSSDGWQLFALSNGTVRSYDFHLDREVPQIGSNVTDIATACSSTTAQQLLLLETGGQVQMHLLNL
ncbi:uncharacterized protein LOC117783305 [Drosophila innubila]|uniref:uncharacterized protein LOC117783305 n=1 Tax=Drosophila innubila TaxID=198719 RepID=UPI00148D9E11|nr:uncharacterized protein LOC117783305 [Drosophila innubila]